MGDVAVFFEHIGNDHTSISGEPIVTEIEVGHASIRLCDDSNKTCINDFNVKYKSYNQCL